MFTCEKYGEAESNRCGDCPGCDSHIKTTECRCASSWEMPRTYKHHTGIRVCSRCHQRRIKRQFRPQAQYLIDHEESVSSAYDNS